MNLSDRILGYDGSAIPGANDHVHGHPTQANSELPEISYRKNDVVHGLNDVVHGLAVLIYVDRGGRLVIGKEQSFQDAFLRIPMSHQNFHDCPHANYLERARKNPRCPSPHTYPPRPRPAQTIYSS